jgi:hypothetical protein
MPVPDEAGRMAPTASAATWLEGMAGIAGSDGRHERAARLLGAAAALRRALGTPLPAHEAGALADAVAAASAAVGEARFRALYDEGQALPLPEAARLATT